MGYMDVIRICQDELLAAYPGLKLRWVRVYGKRWAHFYGDYSESSTGSPLRIEIGQNFGLCIDNGEIIPAEELVNIVDSIRERFSHVDLV